MLCPKCGTENEDEAKFCNSCGELLTPEVAAQNEVPQSTNNTIQEAKEKIGEQFNSVKQEIAGVKSVGDAKTLVLKSRKIQIILGAVSLIILIFLILIVRSCSNNANPASDFEYKAISDGIEITKYIGTSTKVRIPEKIKGKPVTIIGYLAFYDSSITEVHVPNSVTYIRMEAFTHCKKLTSVTLGNSVTTISEAAFYNCISLKSINVPESLTEIGWKAFYNSGLSDEMITKIELAVANNKLRQPSVSK